MSNDTTRAKIETLKDDVRDGIDEVKHRAQGLGDQLKAAGHRAVADADAAKRDARHGLDAEDEK